MYMQITEKCQLQCEHCMFSCGPRGKHATLEVIKQACKIAKDNHSHLFMGGGEPTIHPQFWEVFGLFCEANAPWSNDTGMPPVGLVSNGINEKVVMPLLDLAEQKLISLSISQDHFHKRCAQLSERVQRKLDYLVKRKGERTVDIRGDITYVRQVGRAKRSYVYTEASENCNSCGGVIDSAGDVWQCCHKSVKLGNIFTGLVDGVNWYDIDEMPCCKTKSLKRWLKEKEQ